MANIIHLWYTYVNNYNNLTFFVIYLGGMIQMNTNINENVINTRRNNRIIKHNDAVYKVFNEGYSKEDVFAEA